MVLSRLFSFLKKKVTVHGVDQLPEGRAKAVAFGDPYAGGRQLLLCRVEGQLYALDTTCPHEGGRLIEGPLMDGQHALCPLHNYRFDPKNGRCVNAGCANAKTYRVEVEGSAAKIWL